MIIKLLTSSVMLLCIFNQSLAQVSGDIEWKDAQTLQQQSTLLVGETIFIDVRRVPELTGEYHIDKSGRVDLPLIGKVKALEQTPASFARILEILYEKDYLHNPIIRVKLADDSAASKSIERSLNPTIIEQQIKIVSNDTLKLDAPEAGTLETVISSSLRASDTEISPAGTLGNALTSNTDIQNIYEPSLALVDIQTNPEPILTETSSSLVGTHWSLGSDAIEVIHFLSEGEMAGTVGCNNFFATYEEHSPNIDIRLLGSTFIDCADGTKPKEFVDILEAAYSFAITQNELHLMDKDNEIVFSFSNNHFKP